MKKFFKVSLFVLVIIVLLLMMHPVSPLRSVYSRHVLESNPMVADFNADCRYHKPKILITPNNPYLSCVTIQRFNEENQKVEIKRIETVLQADNWYPSNHENFYEQNITYLKGNLRINIQPYDWEPGRGGADPKLLIDFQHKTYIK